MSENIGNRYEISKELRQDSFYRKMEAFEKKTKDSFLLYILKKPWSGRKKLVNEFKNYFDKCISISRGFNLYLPRHISQIRGYPLIVAYEMPKGDPLSGRFKKMEQDERIRVIEELCEGLHTIHNKRILFGYLRPEDLIIDKKGVARISGLGYYPLLTNEDARKIIIAESGEFLAPEISKGIMDKQADIYALVKILTSFTPEIEKLDSVKKALEKDPKKRYKKSRKFADAFREDLNRIEEKKKEEADRSSEEDNKEKEHKQKSSPGSSQKKGAIVPKEEHLEEQIKKKDKKLEEKERELEKKKKEIEELKKQQKEKEKISEEKSGRKEGKKKIESEIPPDRPDHEEKQSKRAVIEEDKIPAKEKIERKPPEKKSVKKIDTTTDVPTKLPSFFKEFRKPKVQREEKKEPPGGEEKERQISGCFAKFTSEKKSIQDEVDNSRDIRYTQRDNNNTFREGRQKGFGVAPELDNSIKNDKKTKKIKTRKNTEQKPKGRLGGAFKPYTK